MVDDREIGEVIKMEINGKIEKSIGNLMKMENF